MSAESEEPKPPIYVGFDMPAVFATELSHWQLRNGVVVLSFGEARTDGLTGAAPEMHGVARVAMPTSTLQNTIEFLQKALAAATAPAMDAPAASNKNLN